MAAIPPSFTTMAAIPHAMAKEGRRSSSSSRADKTSHGRGGAGNIGSSPRDLDPLTLETPTIKGDVYTTGRGGSGNMTRNDDPHAARRAQDVVGQPRRESTSNTHVGRGGAANVFRPSTEEIEKATRHNEKWEEAIGDEESVKAGEKTSRGLADKGKDWLLRQTSNVGKEISNVRETSSGDDDSLTLAQDEKSSKGLADKGKDWLLGLAK